MKFGAVVLVGNEAQTDNCSSSWCSALLGRLASIVSLSHDNLCRYLELIKCQTISNGVIIINEHHSVEYCRIQNGEMVKISPEMRISIAVQLCSAIDFCHSNSIVIGAISTENVLFCMSNNERVKVKLLHFGLYYISNDSDDIKEAICPPMYFAPECVLNRREKLSFCTDIWSFGILLVEIFTGWKFAKIWSRKQVVSVLRSIIFKTKMGSCLENLLDSVEVSRPTFKESRHFLKNVLYSVPFDCLQIAPVDRPDSATLLKILEDENRRGESEMTKNIETNQPIDETIESIKERIRNESDLAKFGFNGQTINEMFFLWKLCGSSVESILIRNGVIKNRPPVLTLPRLVTDDLQLYGNETARKITLSLNVAELPLSNLFERLNAIPRDDLHLSMEFMSICGREGTWKEPSPTVEDSVQSLVVREKDIAYQFKRMHLFRCLLSAFPFKSDLFRFECQKDIPPVYRGAIWATLLGVLPASSADDGSNLRDEFYNIDTFSEHSADRQLQVDIPRCHQYDELMASPMAHHRMKLLIKALLVSRQDDDFVYWQGLDSLSAPFLILHFNDLSTAFRCLNAFIERYLPGFFLRDNSTVIRNYLAEFMRMLEFVDSELFTHLISLDFLPELFAIPWFLTCFAHVLPLHKLFHLWDSLLLADSYFPLFIGVAILTQLRSRLISVSFNEAILLFSDLPDLPIDEIVQIAKIHYAKWLSTSDGQNT
ncbi:hypothetical protein niasHT_006756 [Heterodera trifolii]|uniref:TBC domain-containing protein kinase-like protein n=1 Tax=Heterodera trifolii TaxID=157864 RepID=A0ABD2LWP9_9BILA